MLWLVWVLDGLKVLVIADAVLSWVMSPTQFPRSLTMPLLDPVYTPIRHLLQPLTGAIDLSPLVALAVIYAVQRLVRPRSPSGEV